MDSDGLGLAYINTIISKSGGFIKLEKKKDSNSFQYLFTFKKRKEIKYL